MDERPAVGKISRRSSRLKLIRPIFFVRARRRSSVRSSGLSTPDRTSPMAKVAITISRKLTPSTRFKLPNT